LNYVWGNKQSKILTMKFLLTLFFLFFSILIGFSQTDDGANTNNTTTSIDKNELRLNVASLIGFGGLEVDYEYLFNQEASFGVSLLIGTGDSNDIDLIRNFSFTAYYRQFFSKKYAQGFFVEGFGMVLSREERFFTFNNGFENEENVNETQAALGVSVGGKFLTRNGFVAEIFGGVGRTFGDSNIAFTNIIARGGISLGYRF